MSPHYTAIFIFLGGLSPFVEFLHRSLLGFIIGMGIAHRGADEGMAQQLLHRYDVCAIAREP
jgi:hypothetical protein